MRAKIPDRFPEPLEDERMNCNNTFEKINNGDNDDSRSGHRETRYWLALETLNSAIQAEETAVIAFDDARDDLALKCEFRHESECELWDSFAAAGYSVLKDSTLAQIDIVNRTFETLWDASDPVRERTPDRDRKAGRTSDESLRR